MQVLKDILLIAFGLAIIYLLYLLFFKKYEVEEPTSIRMHYDSIAMYRDSLKASKEKEIRYQDSLKFEKLRSVESEKIYRRSIIKLKEVEAQRRVELQELIDTVPRLRAYISLRDSIDVIREARIDSITQEKKRSEKLYEDMIELKDAEIMIHQDLLRHSEVIIQEKNKQIQQTRKKNGFYFA